MGSVRSPKPSAFRLLNVNGLLDDLKAAGRVLLDVGKNGTRVKLVA